MGEFVDRLVAYIEGPCGQIGFRSRMKGYPDDELREFEDKHFKGALPREYREFLKAMGISPSEFKLKDDDLDGFHYVRRWYEDPNLDEESALPTGQSIVIAVGQDETYYVLAGDRDGRPVLQYGLEDSPRRVADSFENLCLQNAWQQYRVTGLKGTRTVDFLARPEALERALDAAAKAGLAPEFFSEESHRYLSGKGRAAAVHRHDDYWSVLTYAEDEAQAKALAAIITEASGAPLPPTRRS